MMTSRAIQEFSEKKNNNHSFLSVKRWKATSFIRLQRRPWTHTFLNSKKGLKQRAHTLRAVWRTYDICCVELSSFAKSYCTGEDDGILMRHNKASLPVVFRALVFYLLPNICPWLSWCAHAFDDEH